MAKKSVSCVVGFGREVWPNVRKHPVRPLGITLTDAQCTRFPPGEYLGSGIFASAYEKAGSKKQVVKFTGDAVEARNARRLMGKKLKGTVQVFDVAQLRGVTGSLPVNPLKSLATTKNQPLFALTTERVKELPYDGDVAGAVKAVWAQYGRLMRDSAARKKLKPSTFRVRDYVDYADAVVACVQSRGAGTGCPRTVNMVLDAIDEQASHGVVPLDLHTGNWGMRGKQPVILDLGVSVDDKKRVKIDLARAPTRRRKR